VISFNGASGRPVLEAAYGFSPSVAVRDRSRGAWPVWETWTST
jgi:hypothetical protein